MQLQRIELTAERWRQLDRVHLEVGEQIAYRTDRVEDGQVEWWADPAETERRGYGDCEDIARVKRKRLLAMDWLPECLPVGACATEHALPHVVIDHAVLLILATNGVFVADNRYPKWIMPIGELPYRNWRMQDPAGLDLRWHLFEVT